jgi:NAD-dependent DNA ligase
LKHPGTIVRNNDPREEIEQKMDELAREYHETHDPEIPEEIFDMARRLKEMEH